MCAGKLRGEKRKLVLQFCQLLLAGIQSSLQKGYKIRGICPFATLHGLSHTLKSVCYGIKVLLAEKCCLFEVVKQSLERYVSKYGKLIHGQRMFTLIVEAIE